MGANKTRISFVKRKIPLRGPFSTDEYNASMEELSVDLADLSGRWNNEAYPVLNSLPRGDEETRWSGATNVPDPLSDGLDGDNIFVDNNASSSKDDGLFWSSTDSRPRTVRELGLYLDGRITSIYETLENDIQSSSNGLTSEQWTRLGLRVKDGTSTSAADSTDGKASSAYDDVNTLVLDVFNDSGSLGSLGSSTHTLEEMIGKLCSLHGGAWNTNPSGMSHTTNAYTNAFVGKDTEESEMPDYSSTNIVSDGDSLETAIGKLDQEAGYANAFMGKAVGNEMPNYTSAIYVSDGQSLEDAISTLDDAIYTNGIALVSRIGYMEAFAGKDTDGSEMPSYSSTNVVSNGDSLETAIGKLDSSVAVRAVREVYSFSSHTNISTPIVIAHDKGTAGVANSTYPLVQVIDKGIGGDYGVLADENYQYEAEHGIAASSAFVNIEYIDENTFHVYTSIVNGVIVAVF